MEAFGSRRVGHGDEVIVIASDGSGEEGTGYGVVAGKAENSSAWSKMWPGPETIIFGHDAKRGLQQEKFAIGLDSGACYGNRLSSIVLPDEVIVSVDSDRIYCPISNKKESK